MKAAILLSSLILATQAMAIYVMGYSETKHERFLVGTFPAAPVNNLQSISAFYNLSSVGWVVNTPAQTVTLISPIHFVCANHWKPAVGAQVAFFSQAQSVVLYRVVGYTTFAKSDVALGVLEPLSEVAVAAVASRDPALLESNLLPRPAALPSARSSVNGKPVLAVGQNQRVGTNTVSYKSGYTGSTLCDWVTEGDTLCHLYDSGSPLFVVHNGCLVLFGTASTVSGSTTNYAAVMPVLSSIRSVVGASGFSLQEVLVR